VCLYTGGQNPESLTKERIDTLNLQRNQLMENLQKRGISTRQGTHAVHTVGYYRNKYGLKDEQFLNSYAADRLSITLPLYPEMAEEDVHYVVETLAKEARACVV